MSVPVSRPAPPSTVRWATLLLFVCAGLSLINAVPLFLPSVYAGLPADVVAPTAVLLALVSVGAVAVPASAALAVRSRRRWPRIVIAAYAALMTASVLSGVSPNLVLLGAAAAALAAVILLWMPAARRFAVSAEIERPERARRPAGWNAVPSRAVPASVAAASGVVTFAGAFWTIPITFILFPGPQPGPSASDWQTVVLAAVCAAAHFAVAFACWRGQTWVWAGVPILLIAAAVVSLRVTPVALLDVTLLLAALILLLTRNARAYLGTSATRRASTRS
ncbi:hypothetical protein Agsp01_32030 [Agromyces sp. NBRC 114283]|nr:hypothetical protein Agsp01_32030 [Agromyces sp. NBRC 114283]